MEGYNNSDRSCAQAVLTFMSAWTSELHALGYLSGAYGSSSSLMVDMSNAVAAGTSGFVPPDDVWFAHWNSLQTLSDSKSYPAFKDGYWSRGQRLHQYDTLTETWGGVKLNIDANWLGGQVAGAPVPVDYGTNVFGPGSRWFVFTGRMSYWKPNQTKGLRGRAYSTYANGSTESNGATWYPQLPPGKYAVSAYIPSTRATATVPYTIKDANGSVVRTVNQSAVTGYVSLGQFVVRSGSPITVHLGDNGPSASSAEVAADAMAFRLVTTVPSAPRSVSAIPGDKRATVRWSAAADNGSPLTGYTVTASPGGATTAVAGTATSAVVTGLANGTAYTFTVKATNGVGTGPASAPSAAVTPLPHGHLVPVAPVRLLDTRRGTATNPVKAVLAPGASITVKVAGVTGSPVPAGATAAAVNLTATAADGVRLPHRGRLVHRGHVHGELHGGPHRRQPRHRAASRRSGTLTVVNHSSGTVHVIADVEGYLTASGTTTRWVSTAPKRLVDTRVGTTTNPVKSSLAPGASLTVRVAGVTGSPVPSGASAAAVNLTATGAAGVGLPHRRLELWRGHVDGQLHRGTHRRQPRHQPPHDQRHADDRQPLCRQSARRHRCPGLPRGERHHQPVGLPGAGSPRRHPPRHDDERGQGGAVSRRLAHRQGRRRRRLSRSRRGHRCLRQPHRHRPSARWVPDRGLHRLGRHLDGQLHRGPDGREPRHHPPREQRHDDDRQPLRRHRPRHRRRAGLPALTARNDGCPDRDLTATGHRPSRRVQGTTRLSCPIRTRAAGAPMPEHDHHRPGLGSMPHEGGTAFRVWAPNADAVSVTGSFTEWSPDGHPMEAEDGGHWYADVAGVGPGAEYQFVIHNGDQRLMRIDPRARAVTNSSGNGVVYDRNGFDWQDDGFVCPPHDQLVIYETHIGSYLADSGRPGDLAGLAGKLDYLVALGVNAIELMPVAEFAGDYSWGYNPSNPFAVEHTYGGPDLLKAFVREAHRHGIAVIVDVVLNHFGPSDLALWQFDGWSEDGKGGIYFYNDERSSTPWGETRPDYGREQVRAYLHDNALMWLDEYHLDGLRFDATLYIRTIDGLGTGDLPEGWDLMRAITTSVRESRPDKILIAEDLQNDAALTTFGEGGAGFHAQWDAGFVHPVRQALTAVGDSERSMLELAEAIGADGDPFARIIYTESHDEVANGKLRGSPRRSTAPTQAAGPPRNARRSASASPSPATASRCSSRVRSSSRTSGSVTTCPSTGSVPSSSATSCGSPGTSSVCAATSTPPRAGLTGDGFALLHLDDEAKTLAWARTRGEEAAVVVANVSAEPRDITTAMPSAGHWTVRFNSDASTYSALFAGHETHDVDAVDVPGDDVPARGTVSVGAYSLVVLTRA